MTYVNNFIKNDSIEDIDSAKKTYTKLISELNHHNFLYYIESSPVISDFEYDRLFDFLKKLEADYPELISLESPTQRLNGQIQDELRKAEHRFPLLSLENSYSPLELEEFIDRIYRNHEVLDLFIEPKYDGLSVELVYKDWKFFQAITRWNGVIWEDVTENVKTIASLPLEISHKQDLHIRWEVVIRKSIFKKVNESQQKKNLQTYSNSRNLASGSLRQLNVAITRQRNLDIIVYDILNYKELWILNHIESLNILEKNNFFVLDLKNLCPNIVKYREAFSKEKVLEIVSSSKIKEALDEYDIDFDWLVIKVNSTEKYDQIGYTAHHPKRAFSFKYPPKQFSSVLLDVEFSVWRTGVITPVAILEPVNISWVNVKRASLHNFDFIKEKNIKIWNSVLVQRSWEVIPYIVWVIGENWEDLRDILEPKSCPVCDWKTFRPDWEVAIRCINISCSAQTKEKIAYFASRNWIDIDWLWLKTIDTFYESWVLRDYWDIFYIPEHRQKLLWLPLFQEKKIDNLIESIKDKQNLELDVFLTALWIEFVGKKTAKIIIESMLENWILDNHENVDFQNLIDSFLSKPESEEFLLTVHWLWPQTVQSFIRFFAWKENQKVISKILNKVNLHIKKANKSWEFSWKVFCISWNLKNIQRQDVVDFIEKKSWGFSPQVVKSTNVLLVGENPWNSKIAKAKNIGIPIYPLQEFLNENWFKFPVKSKTQNPLF